MADTFTYRWRQMMLGVSCVPHRRLSASAGWRDRRGFHTASLILRSIHSGIKASSGP